MLGKLGEIMKLFWNEKSHHYDLYLNNQLIASFWDLPSKELVDLTIKKCSTQSRKKAA